MSYISHSSGMELSAKQREMADGVANADAQAQQAIKGGQTNVVGQREAAAKFQAAKIDMAKANVQLKVSQADLSFKAGRAIVTALGGAGAGFAAHFGDKRTDLSRAKVTAANQDVANDRIDNVHGQKLGELLDFKSRLQEAETNLQGQREALAKFNTDHPGELTSHQANERAALRRGVQDAEQRVGELQALSGFALTTNNTERLEMGGAGEDIVNGYLKRQGMNRQQIQLVDQDTRDKLRTQLTELRQDRDTVRQGANAKRVVDAEKAIGDLQAQKTEAEVELQSAHQRGDAHQIQQAETKLKVIDGKLDEARTESSNALDDFRRNQVHDTPFWERAVGSALRPFIEDLKNQVGPMMQAAQAYAQAVQAMSNASAAAGQAAAEAEKLGVDLG